MEFWKNKRVWIIGSSSGIGEGLFHCLIKQGASVVISARRQERLELLAQSASSTRVRLLPLDVGYHEIIAQKVKEAWGCFGGLDVVFLNAGIAVRDRVEDTAIEVEKKLFNINFWGLVAVTKTIMSLKNPEETLHLAVTSSLSGKYGVPKLAAYSASKHALHGYFDSLRAENAQTNLKIHLVIPGFIRTDITVSGLRGDGSTSGKMQNALQKGMDPERCAELILKGIQKGKEEFAVGGMERFTVFFNRIFPGLNRLIIRSNPLQKLQRVKSFFGIK